MIFQKSKHNAHIDDRAVDFKGIPCTAEQNVFDPFLQDRILIKRLYHVVKKCVFVLQKYTDCI